VTFVETMVDDHRIAAARSAAVDAGIDALLITPGPDLRYFTGYDAVALERLTCLIIPASGAPCLVAPQLEVAAAQASPLGGLDLKIHGWAETDDPYALVAKLVPGVREVGLCNSMSALAVLSLRDAMPAAHQLLAGDILGRLRMIKSADEVEQLRRAGRAIDRVHEQVPDLLRPGRSEREVAEDITEAILEAGHHSVDFVIVGSGPNAASPHHEVSDRQLGAGDVVVVDIGGSLASGYCSDSTRTYAIGHAPSEFVKYYDVLQEAQAAAVAAVCPGVSAEFIDAVARQAITDAGFGELFIHRTGHGIGLETHEGPYIVAGNKEELQPGMAFSVEPGIYVAGEHGARIEDIVVVTDTGVEPMNLTTHDLVVVDHSFSG
jgi:Xaa-Pro aminopeptidase